VERQYGFIKKGTTEPKDYHVFMPGSSAALQHKAGRGISCPTRTPIPIPRGEQIPWLIESLLRPSSTEGILVWEPLAYIFQENPNFETVHGSEFPIWIWLFCHREWLTEAREKQREAFRQLFIDEWRRCKADQKRAFRLVTRPFGVLDYFAVSAGIKPVQKYRY